MEGQAVDNGRIFGPGFKARTSWIRNGIGSWEMMSDGEIDVSRASLCVMWWGTKGGKKSILNGAKLIEREDSSGVDLK